MIQQLAARFPHGVGALVDGQRLQRGGQAVAAGGCQQLLSGRHLGLMFFSVGDGQVREILQVLTHLKQALTRLKQVLTHVKEVQDERQARRQPRQRRLQCLLQSGGAVRCSVEADAASPVILTSTSRAAALNEVIAPARAGTSRAPAECAMDCLWALTWLCDTSVERVPNGRLDCVKPWSFVSATGDGPLLAAEAPPFPVRRSLPGQRRTPGDCVEGVQTDGRFADRDGSCSDSDS